MRRTSEIRNPKSDGRRWDPRRLIAFGISTGLRLTRFLCLAAASGLAQPTNLERAPLHFGLTRSTFRNVNPNDAEAALRLLARTVGRQQGYELDTSTRVFDSPTACAAEIKQGGLSVLILDALEYLALDIPEMEPAFVHLEQGVVLKDHLLLTRRGSGLNTVADLRDKDVLVLFSKSGGVSMAWLEVLLLENGLGTPAAFFKRVDLETKPSTTVLPVFFGRKAACVVDRLSFETLVELNPQVGRVLAPVAVSDPYLDSITCINRTGFSSGRSLEDLKRSLRDLHLEPAGRQILTLFKVDQLVPFREEYLEGVTRLRSKSARLKTREPAPAGTEAVLPSPTPEPKPAARLVQESR